MQSKGEFLCCSLTIQNLSFSTLSPRSCHFISTFGLSQRKVMRDRNDASLSYDFRNWLGVNYRESINRMLAYVRYGCCCWSHLYGSILLSRADSLGSCCMWFWIFVFHGALRPQKPVWFIRDRRKNGAGNESPGPPPSSHISWALRFWMSNYILLLRVFWISTEVVWPAYSAVWLLHGWCHVKLLPSFSAVHTAISNYTPATLFLSVINVGFTWTCPKTDPVYQTFIIINVHLLRT